MLAPPAKSGRPNGSDRGAGGARRL